MSYKLIISFVVTYVLYQYDYIQSLCSVLYDPKFDIRLKISCKENLLLRPPVETMIIVFIFRLSVEVPAVC